MKQFLIVAATVLCTVLTTSYAQNTQGNPPAGTSTRPVTGKVTDENGQPLADATVEVENSNVRTITAKDGTFKLQLPADAKRLVISFVGMETKTIEIGSQDAFSVGMKSMAGTSDEVIVVGYTTQKKVNLTGAVGTVKGDVLLQRPVPNAGNLLQGRITGLQITQPSAEPGRDNPNFLIRGRGSFGASNNPLILIDGVAGAFNNVSPNDIENVTVLKDAASAAIYGSRAANGVILVTTKKGSKGKPTLSYSMNVGVYKPTALPKLINNSAEYMEMYNKAAIRGGVAFKYDLAEIEKYRNPTDPNQYPSFNNMDYYFNNAVVQNHNLGLSGSTEKSNYNISLSYLDQEAMLPGYDFKRYNVLLNYTNQVTKRVSVGTIMNMAYKNRQEPPFTSENLALAVYAAGPLYGPFLPDGSGRIVSRAYQGEGRNRNPQEAFAMGWQNTKEYNINAQAFIDIKIAKGLTLTSKAAINYVDEYYKMYQHPYNAYLLQQKDPLTGDYQTGASAFFGPDYLGVTDQYAKVMTPTLYSVLNYQNTFAKDHSFQALVGFEQITNKSQGMRARRLNGVSTALEELTGYSNTGEAINATYPRLPGLPSTSEWGLQSFFGRVNYAYKRKYLLEGNVRYDGTSRVSPDYRWGWFPSVSAGWLASEEDFLRNALPIVNNLKLRASYGTLGNQDIGNYPYQNVLTVSGISYPFGNTTPAQGAVLNTYRDQSLKWETTTILDLGVDMDLRKGLFGFSFDYFNKVTNDILAAQPVPASLGLGSPTFNNGKMEVKGIELEVRHQNTFGEFHYSVNGQFSTAKNKVLDIKVPGFGTSINQVGLPYGSHYLYVWDGIFQEEDVLVGAKVPRHVLNPNPKAGDLKMKDVTGDGVVDANDRVVVDGAYPEYLYSFGLNADYKRFSFSAFFQGVEGLKNRVNNWGVDPFMQGTSPTEKWRNAWTPQNRSNTLPALYVAGYTGVAAYVGSTYYLMDASYLRLKNVMLSYALPDKWASKIKANYISVYVSADNLFTITDYEGSDPERSSTTGNYVQYPQAQIFTTGLTIKF
ncbi:MAG TPA: TonB-dependent receptor [Phnomibacter sp.]|nr:TonB-dependent receptor [Phnomibacter sp.]